jgi:hypothetical protein
MPFNVGTRGILTQEAPFLSNEIDKQASNYTMLLTKCSASILGWALGYGKLPRTLKLSGAKPKMGARCLSTYHTTFYIASFQNKFAINADVGITSKLLIFIPILLKRN